jgi:hypothetical protein
LVGGDERARAALLDFERTSPELSLSNVALVLERRREIRRDTGTWPLFHVSKLNFIASTLVPACASPLIYTGSYFGVLE